MAEYPFVNNDCLLQYLLDTSETKTDNIAQTGK